MTFLTTLFTTVPTSAEEWQWWGDNYLDNIEYYGLEVDTIAPVHMPIMSHEAVVQMVAEGVARTRELCVADSATQCRSFSKLQQTFCISSFLYK